jgi:hypothetical protein
MFSITDGRTSELRHFLQVVPALGIGENAGRHAVLL